MKELTVEITNESGLHARPATGLYYGRVFFYAKKEEAI